MSKAQYDLNTKTDYLHRKMFLDPEGPVTIQRFEEVKYPKIQKIEQTARGFYWVPEEISLTKDAGDFKESSDAVKHIFTSNLLRQTALDSLQGRGPAQVFTPCVSLPELEALMYNWSFFETNIAKFIVPRLQYLKKVGKMGIPMKFLPSDYTSLKGSWACLISFILLILSPTPVDKYA